MARIHQRFARHAAARITSRRRRVKKVTGASEARNKLPLCSTTRSLTAWVPSSIAMCSTQRSSKGYGTGSAMRTSATAAAAIGSEEREMTETAEMRTSTEAFRAARDFLLQRRTDYESAYRDFTWPQFDEFNWALNWFDVIARDNQKPALWIVEEDGRETKRSFAEMAERSNRVANWLRSLGVRRGDRVILMLGN